jgi:hypothetical protein
MRKERSRFVSDLDYRMCCEFHGLLVCRRIQSGAQAQYLVVVHVHFQFL